jgi:hypothetical protein
LYVTGVGAIEMTMTEQIEKKKKEKEIKSVLNKPFKDIETALVTREKTIYAIDDKYIAEFKVLEETKKSIIQRWARELKEKVGMRPEIISSHITNIVKENKFCHPDKVRHALGDEFKDKVQQGRAQSGGPRAARTKSGKKDNKSKEQAEPEIYHKPEEQPCPHCHLKPSEDPKDDADIIWEIPVEQFNYEEINSYDRNFLIQKVAFDDKIITKLRKRIKELEDELKA